MALRALVKTAGKFLFVIFCIEGWNLGVLEAEILRGYSMMLKGCLYIAAIYTTDQLFTPFI